MDCYFSGMNTISPLVNTTWLFENLDNPMLILLDGSLKNPVKEGATIDNKIIPTALSFDWDSFSDLTNNLPHMMPNAEKFTQSAQKLGVNDNSVLVVYDRAGIYSSARVWWMFLAMGFENCFVLDGGLPEWLKMGYDHVTEYAKPKQKGNFNAVFKSHFISNQDEVFKASTDKNKLVIDARSADRFCGKAAEPRAGLRLGHIPNALNIPFEEVLFENKIRSKIELDQLFEIVEHKNTPLIFSCGSGVTACIDALAATLVGFKNISIYDGSWSEWGQDSIYPVAKNK